MDYDIEPFAPEQTSLKMIREISDTYWPDEEGHKAWFSSYAKNHSSRIAFDLQIVNRYAGKDERILEYGAIPLLLSKGLKDSGFKVVSLDIMPERYSKAIQKFNLDIRKCNIEVERVPFGDSEFDLILFNELFEHLRINPVFTLKEVCRVLKPGGILLLSTPNLRSLGGLWNFYVRGISSSCAQDIFSEYQKLETVGHMGHFREYTPSEIISFLGRVGFRASTVIWRGSYSGLLPRSVTRLFPRFRPFFSVVATKLESNSS